MRKTKTTVAPKADPQNKELVEAIRALCQEKDLSEDMLFATVEDALKKAYAKNRAKGEAEPSANNISATIDRATGDPPPDCGRGGEARRPDFAGGSPRD